MPKVRIGKTAKDRVNNVAWKNTKNKAERAAWNDKYRTVTGAQEHAAVRQFPLHTCGGKKARTLGKCHCENCV